MRVDIPFWTWPVAAAAVMAAVLGAATLGAADRGDDRQVFASGLDRPQAVVPIDAGSILVAERSGRIPAQGRRSG